MNVFTLILVVLGIVSFISLLSIITTNSYSDRTKSACGNLVELSSKLVATSKQDSNLMFAVIDATAAVAHAESLGMVSSDDNLKSLFKTSAYELLNVAKAQQKSAIKNLGAYYPDLMPDQDDALGAGWL